MNINWYPGHMKKTKDLIVENLKIIDIVIEILDARIPISSKNPDISKLANNKKKIIVLNKVDLIDSKELKSWEDYFLKNNFSDYFVALSVEKGTNFNELRKITDKIYAEKLEKMKKKGLRKTEVRAMIVGIPNVGKSKFINKFVNKNKARVGNTPGFTKGKQIAYLTFSLGGFYFLTSYLITWLIILPISKILKNKNGSTFWGLSANIIFIIAMAIFFALNKNVISAKYFFIPILFLTNGLINIFAFKTMNEIYARDENGKIIFNEETEVDKLNTNKIKK